MKARLCKWTVVFLLVAVFAPAYADAGVGLRAGIGHRGKKDYLFDRYRLFGGLDGDIAMGEANPLGFRFAFDFEGSYAWLPKPDDSSFSSSWDLASTLDLLATPVFEAGSDLKLRAGLGVGVAMGGDLWRTEFEFEDWNYQRTTTESVSGIGVIVGPAIQPSVGFEAGQLAFKGLLRYRYLIGVEGYTYSPGFELDDETFDIRSQSLTLRGEVELAMTSVRLRAGLQAENWKSIGKEHDSARWPKWPKWHDWEYSLYVGIGL